MGVKDLWTILDPVKQHVPLHQLSGQVVAVDLSVWICETQQLTGVVVRPYLRNLFFRVSNLLQMGVKVVFVCDGSPPEIKWDTIRQRLQSSNHSGPFNRGQHRGGSKSGKLTRSHFKSLIRECSEMLDYIGVPCLQSAGEAEAYCALLNKDGLVDACITNDGDAFLYGARTVYRNFTINNKDPHVESYSMTDIEQQLGLGQEKLIGLALLLGCDYGPKGVAGVGKEIAIKFVSTLKGESLLERFQRWTKGGPCSQGFERLASLKKAPHCGTCSHTGSNREHQRLGCEACGTSAPCRKDAHPRPCPCVWCRECEPKAVELNVWKKAMSTPGFPDQRVIDEFCVLKDKLPRSPLQWTRPKIFHFQRFSQDKMEWVPVYGLDKMLPLLTCYDMRQILQQTSPTGVNRSKVMQPACIVKTRVRQGVPCYEIKWNKLESDDITEQEYYVTIESQDVFSKCFPDVVSIFQEQMASKKPKKSGKKKDASIGAEEPQSANADCISAQMEQLRLVENQRIESAPPDRQRRTEKPPAEEDHCRKYAPVPDAVPCLPTAPKSSRHATLAQKRREQNMTNTVSNSKNTGAMDLLTAVLDEVKLDGTKTKLRRVTDMENRKTDPSLNALKNCGGSDIKVNSRAVQRKYDLNVKCQASKCTSEQTYSVKGVQKNLHHCDDHNANPLECFPVDFADRPVKENARLDAPEWIKSVLNPQAGLKYTGEVGNAEVDSSPLPLSQRLHLRARSQKTKDNPPAVRMKPSENKIQPSSVHRTTERNTEETTNDQPPGFMEPDRLSDKSYSMSTIRSIDLKMKDDAGSVVIHAGSTDEHGYPGDIAKRVAHRGGHIKINISDSTDTDANDQIYDTKHVHVKPSTLEARLAKPPSLYGDSGLASGFTPQDKENVNSMTAFNIGGFDVLTPVGQRTCAESKIVLGTGGTNSAGDASPEASAPARASSDRLHRLSITEDIEVGFIDHHHDPSDVASDENMSCTRKMRRLSGNSTWEASAAIESEFCSESDRDARTGAKCPSAKLLTQGGVGSAEETECASLRTALDQLESNSEDEGLKSSDSNCGVQAIDEHTCSELQCDGLWVGRPSARKTGISSPDPGRYSTVSPDQAEEITHRDHGERMAALMATSRSRADSGSMSLDPLGVSQCGHFHIQTSLLGDVSVTSDASVGDSPRGRPCGSAHVTMANFSMGMSLLHELSLQDGRKQQSMNVSLLHEDSTQGVAKEEPNTSQKDHSGGNHPSCIRLSDIHEEMMSPDLLHPDSKSRNTFQRSNSMMEEQNHTFKSPWGTREVSHCNSPAFEEKNFIPDQEGVSFPNLSKKRLETSTEGDSQSSNHSSDSCFEHAILDDASHGNTLETSARSVSPVVDVVPELPPRLYSGETQPATLSSETQTANVRQEEVRKDGNRVQSVAVCAAVEEDSPVPLSLADRLHRKFSVKPVGRHTLASLSNAHANPRTNLSVQSSDAELLGRVRLQSEKISQRFLSTETKSDREITNPPKSFPAKLITKSTSSLPVGESREKSSSQGSKVIAAYCLISNTCDESVHPKSKCSTVEGKSRSVSDSQMRGKENKPLKLPRHQALFYDDSDDDDVLVIS